MQEFLEDLVKLFTNLDEGQPLPSRYRWVAVGIVIVSVGLWWVLRH